MSVSQSIFGVWRHLRALRALPWHHARNAMKTSRYYGLQGPFWRYFRPESPLRWTPIRRSRVVFGHNIPDSDDCFPQNHVNNHCEWPNIVSEARIEPLFVENGQKMTSVDQKVVMVMMWWFLTPGHTILYFVLSRVMVKVKNFLSVVTSTKGSQTPTNVFRLPTNV